MENYIMDFSNIRLADVPEVGGKNASLGEMTVAMSRTGIRVPEGFAVTTAAFRDFMDANKLRDCFNLLDQLDRENYANLHETGAAIRSRILEGRLPEPVTAQIVQAYVKLSAGTPLSVAVRSSATAEDMPDASFAGQHDSFLHITGIKDLLHAVVQCYASLFTDRAIKYREERKIGHAAVAISVGVQKMVAADTGCSGVCFTLEPESGCGNIILITGVWGLGENIVQGTVEPDEYYVFKPSLRMGKQAIIMQKTGRKETILRYAKDSPALERVDTPEDKRMTPVLESGEITMLANWSLAIETHYRCPMDIEWAKDGSAGDIYILQARPETVHSRADKSEEKDYRLLERAEAIVKGEAVGNGIAAGIARLLHSPLEAETLQPGDIIITANTTPDWDPLLKKAGGIVTDSGGRTSHAAIVARETGIPAIVGTGNATAAIRDGSAVTISCSEGKTGFVYPGKISFEVLSKAGNGLMMPDGTEVTLILSDPDQAFRLAAGPGDGVGLLRMEFIITHTVKVHPMALVNFDVLEDDAARRQIEILTQGYRDKKQYFIDRLSSGIAMVAAAFYPRNVIVRMSDFKTNEYAQLTGGKTFEPEEENPMLGFRGASRYYHPLYREGFGLECQAVKKVRDEMGLTNVKVMIPFCRTVQEGRKVLEVMRSYGLSQRENGLEVYVMAEIPSNVVNAAGFAEIFDGFSIGSNDLTQLVLGVDRDSSILAGLYSEEDPACKLMISQMIREAGRAGVPVGFCGQAPSDIPGYASFLVSLGINSISFNPDALIKGIKTIREAEENLQDAGKPGHADHHHSRTV
ncbi:phosphoenolpyruvate synthase [Chitinophaga cymbidii]|uniref:Phosphoenolpyruvate synthase n=1 Tax=Chitinophaga cymbidii TaxID=1096750 RepID=A0A512RMR8_9BACT|nr:phosphoenolpyruvate synthase [Chitinophaga cymbidii]GEP96995.1 phosphoenolpyruvate synthase [Chitinophaga cymbidii]